MNGAAGARPESAEAVLVVGAGTMGAGIAQVCATAGHRVRLADASAEALASAPDRIGAGLRRLEEKDRLDGQGADAVLARIEPVRGDPADAAPGCGVVLEAIVEDARIKSEAWSRLGSAADDGALLGSNTSSLSITALGAASGRPADLCGLHFFNPVAVLPLVEVVRGEATAAATVDRAAAFAQGLGKTPVRCLDRPGFLVNRLLIPYVNEAATLLDEGAADAEAIDAAMRLGAGMPMGPLALADLIGLDVVLAVMETLHDELGDPRYRPAPVLRRMVRAGRLGRKSGRGFHTHGGTT